MTRSLTNYSVVPIHLHADFPVVPGNLTSIAETDTTDQMHDASATLLTYSIEVQSQSREKLIGDDKKNVDQFTSQQVVASRQSITQLQDGQLVVAVQSRFPSKTDETNLVSAD